MSHNALLSCNWKSTDEDLSQSADIKTESNPNKNAVWTKLATMAMLSLYEANIQMLKDIGKKSMVWQKISECLKDLCIQVTADQVKWKFNRLYNKYKECIGNNNQSGRAPITFEYYEKFEEIFRKEKNVSISSSFSSSILTTDAIKRKHDIAGSRNISKSKKFKIDAISSENNLPLKTTPVADVKQNARNQQRIQRMEILEKIQENQKAKNERMTKYLKMKEKELDLKKKAINVRETEIQLKRDVASEKLKFNEKKHKDWLNIEKLKCELLKKLLKNRTDNEECD